MSGARYVGMCETVTSLQSCKDVKKPVQRRELRETAQRRGPMRQIFHAVSLANLATKEEKEEKKEGKEKEKKRT